MAKLFNTKSGLLLTVACLAISAPAMAQSDAASETTQDEASEGGEIVVTGIRGSIARASEIKRNSAQIVDAISAEDLGKLPDTNIAEGLQRITGVQIQRTGGEGNAFQIRGANENLTLINGREVAPDADTASAPAPVRQVNLFNYPSELFGEVVVYKSPSASLIEGGVGGTVDLRMPDPLRAPVRTLIAGQIGKLSLQDKTAFGGTFVTSQRFMDNRLGVIFGATYFKRRVTSDGFGASSYNKIQTLDVTGDGVADPNVVTPLNMTYNRELNTRERFTLNTLVAFEPIDSLRLYLDASYIRQSNDRARSFIGFNFTSAQSPSPAAAAETQAEDDGTITVLAGTFRNVAITQDALNQSDDRNLYTVAAGANWQATERLKAKVELGKSWSKVDQFTNVYQLIQTSNVTAAFDIRGEVPTVNVVTGGDITDPAAYRAAVVNVRNARNEPEVKQGRIDFEYDLGEGFLDKLSVGGRATRSFFDAQILNNRYANSFPIGTNIPATRFPEYLEQRELDNFMGGISGLPVNFVVASVPGTEAGGIALLKKFGDDGVLRAIPESNYQVVERTKAAYAQLDFGSGAITGNVGVRWVRTELTSSGNAVATGGVVTPVVFENDYDDWLPSLNVKWSVADNVILRGSAAKVLARPPIPSLTAGTNVSFGIGGLNQASSGQPLLKPFRATQFDLGLEYYFDDGGYLSGALFYKDIASYVTQTTISGATLPGFPGQTFFLTAPSNGPGGRSQGFEIGVQRSFGFLTDALRDFGIIANYTFVDSKRAGSSLQIENTSKHSYNIIGYFESGPFQARLAYNWRSSQYTGLSRGFDIYANARGQLDGSLSFDVNDIFSITLEGSNLLESPQTGYSDYASRLNSYAVNDRSVLLGVRARF